MTPAPLPPTTKKNPGLGAAVSGLRHLTQRTQAEIAERAGLSQGWISRIESGEVDPAWGDMRRVAVALDTRIDRLAALAEELEPPERRKRTKGRKRS